MVDHGNCKYIINAGIDILVFSLSRFKGIIYKRYSLFP